MLRELSLAPDGEKVLQPFAAVIRLEKRQSVSTILDR
jgi:hypothetical protein